MRSRFLLGACLVLLLTSLRLIHLGADTPAGFAPCLAVYVDEGYKTLAARNLLLFGSSHWHPADDYPGWMRASPLTQGSYYLGFRLFGARVEVARGVTCLYFALFLIAFAVATSRRYRMAVWLLGLAALGLEGTLFFFSRIALFEMPMITVVYGLVTGLLMIEKRSPTFHIALALLVAAFVTFAIKKSGLVYTVPIVAAAVAWSAKKSGLLLRRIPSSYALGTLIGGAMLLGLTADTWLPRLEWSRPLGLIGRILFNPLNHVSPIVVVAGTLAAVHGIVVNPGVYLNSLYRLSLTALVLGGPVVMALFPGNPMRYYVPLLPAYVLSVLEWLHVRAWRMSLPERLPWPRTLIGIAGLSWCVFLAADALNEFVLRPLVGDAVLDPLVKPERRALLWVLCPTALFVGAGLWAIRRGLFRRQSIGWIGVGLATLFVSHGSWQLGSFLLNPSYDARRIRVALARLVERDQIVGGDWAPFFALGTDVRALYMNRYVNRAQRVHETRPDYFLYSNAEDSAIWLEELERVTGASLGRVVYESQYIGRRIALYEMQYATPQLDSSSRH